MELADLKVVRYEVDAAGVALVTLSRPERLNAWTGRMHTEYRWCLAAAEADPGVRVVVVTGDGRGFCAGADTRALDGHAAAGRYDPGTAPGELAEPGFGVRPEFDHPFAFHFGLRFPVIAAVNGPAAGVGLVLACFCDVRFAAAGAKLTTSAPRLGLPAEYGLSWVLPRLVGIGHAADLLLSSRVVLAEEAAAMGLVNRVVPPGELLATTLAYARDLATGCSPAAVREAKHQLYADLHGDVGTAVARSEALLERMVTEPDFAEGVAAWQERRRPRF
ncbi:MAG: enoyl-CoA hydratase/isomerase family protein [Actinobacteria bacterium]|nr:enoyl-CoA hydratase/isomerase family protein [Actinomycetota bacterium]